MKVFGKKTITIDCSWEFENNSELMSKLESLGDDKFIDYCFENGNFEEGHKHNPNFEIIEIEKIGDDSF